MNHLQHRFYCNDALYRAYMPYIQGGAIFISTSLQLSLRDEVSLSIQLPNHPEVYTLATQVAWRTPQNAQGNKPAGLGLQFLGEQGPGLKDKIESLIKDMLQSTQVTDTI